MTTKARLAYNTNSVRHDTSFGAIPLLVLWYLRLHRRERMDTLLPGADRTRKQQREQFQRLTPMQVGMTRAGIEVAHSFRNH